jgi:hypothetical protein
MNKVVVGLMLFVTLLLFGSVRPGFADGCTMCPPGGSCSIRGCSEAGSCVTCEYDCLGDGMFCTFTMCTDQESQTQCDRWGTNEPT